MLILAICALFVASASSYGKLESFPENLLQEVISRYGGDVDLISESAFEPKVDRETTINRVAKDFHARFQPRMDDLLLDKELSLRDQEYLQHSSLFGHQYMTGGAGEGYQRLKPDGSVKNIQVVKTDAVLPAYCNPPNPCPLGYSSEDGCLEDFSNSAAFSKEYQSSQDCMCDSEHMFDCPGNTEENELDALARSIQNHGLSESTFDKIVENMSMEDEKHKVVAKKFFSNKMHSDYLKSLKQKEKRSGRPQKSAKNNPYLEGVKLPVVAKKAPHLAKI